MGLKFSCGWYLLAGGWKWVKAIAGLLIGVGGLVILGLVPTHWWVILHPDGLWLERPGGLQSSDCALVCGDKS